MVPHMPPDKSIGYCRTRLSVTLTKLSLIAAMVPQYLSSVSCKRISRLAIMLWLPGLPNLMADFLGLGPVNEVFSQPLDDLLQVFLKILLSAIVVDQVLNDVTRELIDPRVDGEPLVDDLASKQILEMCVHGSIHSIATRLGPCP